MYADTGGACTCLPVSIGNLELLEIPGHWGRDDAFGRGRIELEQTKRKGT
jgi:hypothetical protein